jgi:predicted nucleic acid-binding protein
MVESGDVQVFRASHDGRQRAFAFMAKFKDQPCDYADATLLVAAEETGLRRIFAYDRHFHAYRLTDGTALEVVP